MNYKRLLKICADEKGVVPTRINILNVGQFNTTKYGPMEITDEMCKEMIVNFNNALQAGETLPIDAEHYSDQGAYGWIKSLEFSDGKLWATVDWNSWGLEALSNKVYKFFSPEFAEVAYHPETSEEFHNVLMGGGLTNRPLFRSLQPIMANNKETKEIIYLNEDTMKTKEGAVADKEKKDLEETKEEDMTPEEKKAMKKKMEDDKAKEDAKDKENSKGSEGEAGESLEVELNEIADAFENSPMNIFKTQWYGYRIIQTFEEAGAGHIIVLCDPDCDSTDWGDMSHCKYFQVNFKEDEATDTYIFETPMPVAAEFVPTGEEAEIAEAYNLEMNDKKIKKASEEAGDKPVETVDKSEIAPEVVTEVVPEVIPEKIEENKENEAKVEEKIEETEIKPEEKPVETVVTAGSDFDEMQGFSRDALLKMEKDGTTKMKCRDGVVRNIKDGVVVANEDEKSEEVAKPTDEVVTASVKIEGTDVTITASEYNEFKLAKEELANKQASETVSNLVFNTKIGLRMPTDSKDSLVSFYKKLNEGMKSEFVAILGSIPAAKIFDKLGDAGDEMSGEAAYKKMSDLADEIMKTKGVNVGVAFSIARKENKELAKLASEYNESLKGKK